MCSHPLKGKTVLVTGASKGIGLVIAKTLFRDGANVIIHYSSNATPALALEAEFGERGFAIKADLSKSDEIQTLWRSALNWRGRVDVLVNNAGVYVSSHIDDDNDWRTGWNTNLQVNLIAAADLCRYSIQHFENMGAGIIINMASRSSHRGDNAEHLAYGAAKGGLLALTKGIARGFAGKNILAYALAPGWVRTDMAEAHIAKVGEDAVCAALPMKEVTPPIDIAEMICFLATGKVRHATGSTIDITGADYVR